MLGRDIMTISREMAVIQERVKTRGSRLDAITEHMSTMPYDWRWRTLDMHRASLLSEMARDVERMNRLLESVPCEAHQ